MVNEMPVTNRAEGRLIGICAQIIKQNDKWCLFFILYGGIVL